MIRFYDTKNRNDHELPICDAVKRILEDRRDIVQEAETRQKNRNGYSLLDQIVAKPAITLTVKV